EAVTLDTIVSNLVSNARQHVGAEVEVHIRAQPEGANAIVIEVEDNGPGISEANRTRIFTPFFTTARDHGGTGVGLSVVVALVEAHAGQLTLAPELPTRFQVRLPRWTAP
ncbi:MAG: ATP-binding protein, partial [Myxococcota bacterium]